MYFITTKRMLEVCFSAHPNIQYRTEKRRRKISSGASFSMCRRMLLIIKYVNPAFQQFLFLRTFVS